MSLTLERFGTRIPACSRRGCESWLFVVRSFPPFCRLFCLVIDVLPDVPAEVVCLGSLLHFMNFWRQARDLTGLRDYLRALGDFRRVLHVHRMEVRASFRDVASGRLGDGGGRRRHGGVRRGTAVPLCQLDFRGSNGAAAHHRASLSC